MDNQESEEEKDMKRSYQMEEKDKVLQEVTSTHEVDEYLFNLFNVEHPELRYLTFHGEDTLKTPTVEVPSLAELHSLNFKGAENLATQMFSALPSWQ